MIAGLLEPNTGTVLKSSDRIKASFLRQEFVDELDLEATLLSEFQTAFVEETKALKRYKEVEDDMTASSSDMQKMESLLNEMEDLRQKLDSMDAWNLDSRIDKLLPLLGFTEEDLSAKVGSFSGGWKVSVRSKSTLFPSGLFGELFGEFLGERVSFVMLTNVTFHPPLFLTGAYWSRKNSATEPRSAVAR